MCLVQWKRKNYNLDSKGSHEVPLGSYIGRFTKRISTIYYIMYYVFYYIYEYTLSCYTVIVTIHAIPMHYW